MKNQLLHHSAVTNSTPPGRALRATVPGGIQMRLYLLLFLCLGSFNLFAAPPSGWHTIAAGDITNLANWKDPTNAFSPSSFASTATEIWDVQNAMTVPAGGWLLGGSLSISSTGSIAVSGTITIGGNFTNNGSASAIVSPNMVFNGTGSQVISGTAISYASITYSGSGTLSFPVGTTTVTGAYNQSGSGTATLGSAATTYMLNVGSFTQSAGVFKVANINSCTGTLSISGNFNLTSTAANAFVICNGNCTGTVNVTGTTTVTAGTNTAVLFQESSSSTTGTATFKSTGNVALTGSGASYIDWGFGYVSNNAWNVKSNLSIGGTGSIWISSIIVPQGFVFNGTGTAGSPQILTYSLGVAANAVNIPYLVSANTYVKLASNLVLSSVNGPVSSVKVSPLGTLDFSTFTISGGVFGGGVRIFSNARVVTAHASGFDGSITAVGGFFNSANCTFNGSVAQVTGTIMPTSLLSVSTLTINNPSGVTLSQNTATTGVLAFVNGILNTGSFAMQVPGTSTAVTGAGAGKYVKGKLTKTAANEPLNFEVGDNNSYTPLKISPVPNTSTGSISVKVTAGNHPNIATSQMNTTQSLTRYWTISNSTLTGTSGLLLQAFYNAADMPTGSNDLYAGQAYRSGAWQGSLLAATNAASPSYSSYLNNTLVLASIEGDYMFGMALAVPPTITAVNPVSAVPGATITLAGSNFDATAANNIVYFGSVKATVTAATTTSLTVTVPTSATCSKISVLNTVSNMVGYAPYTFVPKFNSAPYVANTVNFANGVTFSAGSTASNIAAGDIDGDGKPDMAVANAGANTVSLYRNISSAGTISGASFDVKVDIVAAAGAQLVRLADLDIDGKLDMVVGTASAVYVYHNNSTGAGAFSATTFTLAQTINVGMGLSAVYIADADGDGRQDIFASQYFGITYTYRNVVTTPGVMNSGSFVYGALANQDQYHMDISVDDIDGDGRQDIMATGERAKLTRNVSSPGSVNYSPGQLFNFGLPYFRHTYCALTDLNGDNKPDVIVTDTLRNYIYIGRNIATSGTVNASSFSMSRIDVPAAAGRIAIGDINGDGKPDIMLANPNASYVSVLLNKHASGDFANASFDTLRFPCTSSLFDIAAVDVDGDGLTDMAGAGRNGVMMVLRNNPLKPITGATTVCAGSTISLSNATAQGVWSSSNTTVATVDASGVVYGVAAGSATISYSGTALSGFALNVATTSITVHPAPEFTDVSTNSPVCAGSTIYLFGAASGGTGTLHYAWTGVGGYTASESAPGIDNATPTHSGTYTITVTDDNSCAITATTTVAVTLPPVINSATSNSPICAGTNLDLSALASGGTGTLNYTWRFGSWYSSSQQNPSVTTAGTIHAGVYTVTVVDDNSCVARAVAAVAVNPAVTITSAGSNSPVCAGGTLSLNGKGVGGTGARNYLWTGPDGFTASTDRPNLPNSGVQASGIYTFKATDQLNCSAEATVSVTVNPTPVITAINNNGPICAGVALNLSSAATGGTGTIGYTWDGPGAFTSAEQNPVIAAAQPTSTGTYTVTVTDENTCWTSAIMTATVNPTPTIIFSFISSPVCEGSSAMFIGGAMGGTGTISYLWTGPNSFSNTIASTSIANTAMADAGMYNLKVTDQRNCSKNVDLSLAVNPSPQITAIGNDGPVCAGTTLNLSSAASGGTGTLRYAWSGPNAFSSTDQNPVIATVPAAGGGIYSLTVTDANNCSSTGGGRTSAQVIPMSPIMGTMTMMTNGAITNLSNATPGGAWTSTVPSVAPINPVTRVVTGVSAGQSTISYTIGNCAATATVTVYPPQICVGSSFQLSDATPGGTWASMNNSVANVGLATGMVTGVGAGNTSIKYFVPGGAIHQYSVVVNPLAATTGSSAVCQGSALALANTTPSGTWSTNNTAIATVNSSGSVTGVSGGMVDVIYSTNKGCVAVKTIIINAKGDIAGTPTVCMGQTATVGSSLPGGNWQSANNAIATVSGSGVITGVSANPVRITYTAPTGCASITTVTVNPLMATTGSVSGCQNATATVANATPGGGVWSCSNTALATVNASGIVSVLNGGTVDILFTTPKGCIAVKPVTLNAVGSIGGTPEVCVGQSATVSVSTGGGNWSTSTGSLATVSSSGVLWGVAAGTPRVSYIWPNGCHVVANVTVRALSQTTGGTAGMCQSGVMTLANTTAGGGVWTSANTSIATVSATGVVRGAGVGATAILFTTPAGCTYTRPVTVNACRTTAGEAATVDEVTEETAAELQLFPNPNGGAFTLSGTMGNVTDENAEIEIINLVGQVIYRSNAAVSQGRIDTRIQLSSDLANGTYLLMLKTEHSGKQFRFVVNR